MRLPVKDFTATTLNSTFTLVPQKRKKKTLKANEQGPTINQTSPDETSPDDRPFPLMKLPGELRNRIYEFHLVSENGLHPTKCITEQELATLSSRKAGHLARRTEPKSGQFPKVSLFFVSRQLNEETVVIYYRYNNFHFDCVGILAAFLESISPERRSLISKVTVDWVGRGCPRAFDMLAQCDNLQSLTLNITEMTLSGASYEHGTTTQQRLVSALGFPNLLKVRGLKNVTFNYVKWFFDNNDYAKQGFEERVRAAVLQPRVKPEGTVKKTEGSGKEVEMA
ncbi:MAG: hypothetical protein M1836_004547 [Candelina mexicana]|nr:MAG: hypothetical protein M1836_004547 [Candelina mexicana]